MISLQYLGCYLVEAWMNWVFSVRLPFYEINGDNGGGLCVLRWERRLNTFRYGEGKNEGGKIKNGTLECESSGYQLRKAPFSGVQVFWNIMRKSRRGNGRSGFSKWISVEFIWICKGIQQRGSPQRLLRVMFHEIFWESQTWLGSIYISVDVSVVLFCDWYLVDTWCECSTVLWLVFGQYLMWVWCYFSEL